MNNYFNDLGESFKDAINNTVIFIPILIQIIISTIIGGLGVGVAISYFSAKYGEPFLALVSGNSLDALPKAFLFEPVNLAIIAVIALATISLIIIFSVYFQTGFLGMINELVENKTTSLRSFLKYTKAFKKVLLYNIYQILISIAIGLPFVIFGALAYYFHTNTVAIWVFGILAAISLLFLIIAGILFFLAILFAEPLLIRKRENAWKNIVKSYKLFKKRTKHVILTGLTLVFTVLVINIAISVLTQAFGDALWISILDTIVQLLYGATITIFLFKELKTVDGKVTAKY